MHSAEYRQQVYYHESRCSFTCFIVVLRRPDDTCDISSDKHEGSNDARKCPRSKPRMTTDNIEPRAMKSKPAERDTTAVGRLA